MLKVSISFIDGSKTDWMESDSFYSRLQSLRRSGLEGKALVHKLISDDWGAPPTWVTITGTAQDGTEVNETIRYR